MKMTPEQLAAAAVEVDKAIKQQFGNGAMACCVVLLGHDTDDFTCFNTGLTEGSQQLRMVLATQKILAQIAVDLTSGNIPIPTFIPTPPTPPKKDWN